jgi:ribokinase
MSGIIAVGSLNMDLSITTARVPAMGETVLGEKFMTSPLGKGANQAVSAAKLGGQVTMIGCVGNDIFGNDLIDNLMQNNVGTEPVRRTKDIYWCRNDYSQGRQQFNYC